MVRRRDFLRGAGAITIIVAGGQVWYVEGEGAPEIKDGPEYEPWKTWRQDAREGPPALLRAAILASNAHNAQPWLFKIDKSTIELHADIKRNLGAIDPYLREMHLSLGCALENLMLAAEANGYSPALSLPPDKLRLATEKMGPELVARIELTPGKQVKSRMYEAIPHRHTNRSPFDAKKPVPPALFEALLRLTANEKHIKMFVFGGDPERKRIAEIIDGAGAKNFADPDMQRSLQSWFRTSEEQMRKLRDGALVDPNRQKTRPPEPYVNLLLSGRLFGIIAVRDRYDREQTLRAGRVWQRAHLLATAWGVAARPENNAVELADHERRSNLEPHSDAQLAEVTGDREWQPTLMFYMGYATVPAQATPRRPVGDVAL